MFVCLGLSGEKPIEGSKVILIKTHRESIEYLELTVRLLLLLRARWTQ